MLTLGAHAARVLRLTARIHCDEIISLRNQARETRALPARVRAFPESFLFFQKRQQIRHFFLRQQRRESFRHQ